MRLRIFTPLAAVVAADGVTALRAEDATGSFGILPGHADFVTSLAPSVVDWREEEGPRRYCAVRGGVLMVTAGAEIAVATREAVAGDDVETLHREILARFQADLEEERTARVESTRLHLAAIREIVRQMRRGGTEAPW